MRKFSAHKTLNKIKKINIKARRDAMPKGLSL
jgi:hypothetical protein